MSPQYVTPAKNFLTPVWIMAGIALVRLILSVTSTTATVELAARHHQEVNKIPLLITWFFFLLMLAEAIIYWQMRGKKNNRRWVWTHLILMIISMVIVPLIFMILYQLLAYFFNAYGITEIYRAINKWRFYFFLICFFAGTSYFVANCVKNIGTATESIEDNIEAIGNS